MIVTTRPCPHCGTDLTHVDWDDGNPAVWLDEAMLNIHICPTCEGDLPRER